MGEIYYSWPWDVVCAWRICVCQPRTKLFFRALLIFAVRLWYIGGKTCSASPAASGLFPFLVVLVRSMLIIRTKGYANVIHWWPLCQVVSNGNSAITGRPRAGQYPPARGVVGTPSSKHNPGWTPPPPRAEKQGVVRIMYIYNIPHTFQSTT